MKSRKGKRRGFILLEVIVAITLLALVLTPLAAMVFKITSRSHRIIGSAYRNGVLMQQVNLLESLPFDSLAIGTSTLTSTSMPYPYTRTVTVSLISQVYELKAKKVILTITPTNPLYKPDTTVFVRSSANTLQALYTDDPAGS
ncbi:MAG: prepilin-type N-terminal cleavage/methylation domain-containing protein [Gemmatimonadota bacterium]|nr:prepilin-type N-terminal cleavage/methylation domain-containing protein [Gemmatimonadota bacterium]